MGQNHKRSTTTRCVDADYKISGFYNRRQGAAHAAVRRGVSGPGLALAKPAYGAKYRFVRGS